MWQSLLRNWIMTTARQRVQQAAAQAVAGEPKDAASASDESPPPDAHAVCHVGVVAALGIETGGLIDRLSGVIKTEGSGFVAREGGLHGRRVVVIESGAGREAAQRATEALVWGHRPRWIISAGFAGALDPRMALGDILMADTVLDARGRSFEIGVKLDPASLSADPRLHVGPLVTVDTILHDPREKLALGQQHAALAADMESIAVAQVAHDEKVRLLSVRVISDAVDRVLPSEVDYLLSRKTTAGRLGAAAGAIFRRPSSIKDLWQLKEDALVASERLASFLVGVIDQLN
jgi:adenosylhomocysteine nucleosidase